MYLTHFADAWFNIELTNDNGYIVVGGDLADTGTGNPYIIKFDEFGNQEWTKNIEFNLIPGNGSSGFINVEVKKDNGYVLSGAMIDSESNNQFCYLLSLNEEGDEEWIKNFGNDSTSFDITTSSSSYIRETEQTSDNGFILVGAIDTTGLGWSTRPYLIKTDQNGNVQ